MSTYAEMLDVLAAQQSARRAIGDARYRYHLLREKLASEYCASVAPFTYRASLLDYRDKLQREVGALSRGLDCYLAETRYIAQTAERTEEKTRFGVGDPDLCKLKEQAIAVYRQCACLRSKKRALEMELYDLEQTWRRVRYSARVTTRERWARDLNAFINAESMAEQDSGPL